MIKNLNLKELKTIPNILSMFRIVLIIPFVIFFLQKNYIAAAIMIILNLPHIQKLPEKLTVLRKKLIQSLMN